MSTTTQNKPYTAYTFDLQGLTGISQAQLEAHYALYQGYVNNTNILNDKIAALLAEGKAGTPEYNEMKRRFGFEYSGMRLHEYYFNNMKPQGGACPTSGKLAEKLTEAFGSVDAFLADFKATGLMRGIGWVILYQDPCENSGYRLQTFYVGDHENGHPAGFKPILVMDVWEHAFTVDYKPTQKKDYIEAFLQNVDWAVVESRLS